MVTVSSTAASSGLSSGAKGGIIGGVIGGVALLAAAAGVVFSIRRRRRSAGLGPHVIEEHEPKPEGNVLVNLPAIRYPEHDSDAYGGRLQNDDETRQVKR